MEYWRNDVLSHHGILGQKWGVRRYQNKDGTLTDAGLKRYRKQGYELSSHIDKEGILVIRDESKEVKAEFNRLRNKAKNLRDRRQNEVKKATDQAIKQVNKDKLIKTSSDVLEEIRKYYKGQVDSGKDDDRNNLIGDFDSLEFTIYEIVNSGLEDAVHETSAYKTVEKYIHDAYEWSIDVDKTTDKLVKAKGKDKIIGFDKDHKISYKGIIGYYLESSQFDVDFYDAKNHLLHTTPSYPDDFKGADKALDEIQRRVFDEYKKKHGSDPSFWR